MVLAELAKDPNARPSIINNALKWTARAADAGIVDAQIALIEHAWENRDYPVFLQHALPIARSITQAVQQGDVINIDEQSSRLLFRCGQLLLKQDGHASEEIQSMWELAARQKNAEAAFSLGLWYARMNEDGIRVSIGAAATSFKKAIRWLTQAGEQGLAKAWYALSLIYQKAEFSQRNMNDAQRYLELQQILDMQQPSMKEACMRGGHAGMMNQMTFRLFTGCRKQTETEKRTRQLSLIKLLSRRILHHGR